MRHEHPGQTLQATALVHEAFMRLTGAGQPWTDRRHFVAIAARAMRQILVEHARARGAQKRWAGLEDRKSTRLNSSHGYISYAVFCLKKKKQRPGSPEQTAAGVVSLGAEWIDETTLALLWNVLDGSHLNAHDASRGLIAHAVTVTSDA